MALRDLLLSGTPVILDGAMGTCLEDNRWGEQDANLTYPEHVANVHRAYAEAGSRILLANTLTLNRESAVLQKSPVDLRSANAAGVRIAREAVPPDRFILGDIGSTGRLAPCGNLTEDACEAAFREQAETLLEAGTAGLMIETMTDVREALAALRVCRPMTALPIFVSLAFMTDQRGGRTPMGDAARDCARQLTDEGADAVGANCGEITPQQMATIIAEMAKGTTLPLIAKPNAGKAELVDCRTLYRTHPEDFAKGMKECTNAGAIFVGGCCGTKPEHIQTISDLFQ